jgi:hypothetical protein
MQTRTTVGFSLSLASVIIGAALHPYPHVKGWLPHRWDAVEQGSAEGVRWMRRESPEALDFVYRVPRPDAKEHIYLVTPNGHEHQLFRNAYPGDHGNHSIQLPREYPPGTDQVEIVIRGENLKPSRFRLRDLPPTRNLFPVDGPEAASQTIGGLRFEATAWSPAARAGEWASVSAAVRLPSGLPPGEVWEWQNVSVDIPFAAPWQESTSWISMGSGDLKCPPSFGITQFRPWASVTPRVRIQGRLAHYLAVDDIFDFGPVEIVPVAAGRKDAFRLRIDRPLVVRSATGLILRLDPPTDDVPDPIRFQPPALYLNAILDDASRLAGLPDAMRRAQIPPEAKIWISPQAVLRPLLPQIAQATKDNRPVRVEWPGLKPGKRRLRVYVRRRILDREYPFALSPNVRHRPDHRAGVAWAEIHAQGQTKAFEPADAPSLDPE